MVGVDTLDKRQDKETFLADQLEQTCHIEGNFERIIRTFDEMNLKIELARGICSHGFSRPSPIQSRAIPPCLEGKDVIAQAQSGTGKTATFVISTLERIDTSPSTPPVCQAMILAPTRELASQTLQVFVEIGQYCNLRCLALIGGTSVACDIEKLREGVHVVVGTPGRVLHMISRGYLSCSGVKLFVLDEADEMLNRGFLEQIYTLFKSLPRQVQCILISATMPDSVMDIAKSFMRDPVTIHVKKEQLTLLGIKQYFALAIDRNNKVDAIIDIMSSSNIPQTVIFVNRQADAINLTRVLKTERYEVLNLHAGLSQTERDEVMNKFRSSECRVLVSTNLISRGIDIQSVSLVINFDLPKEKDVYIHRIGRSGRYGRSGVAINLVTQEELPILKEIEAYYNTSIQELPAAIQEVFAT